MAVEVAVLKCGSAKGRGVFAKHDITKGTLITRDPVLVYADDKAEDDINNYGWQWGKGRGGLCLGVGSLFNHSSEKSNVQYKRHFKLRVMTFCAKRDIKRGEELLLNYGPGIWFEEC